MGVEQKIFINTIESIQYLKSRTGNAKKINVESADPGLYSRRSLFGR
jgi:hypothetical protein